MATSPRALPAARLPEVLGATIVFLLLIFIGLKRADPPAPQPAAADPAGFSAERAMARLPGIASVPHPTGTAANAQVRDYLVEQLTRMGLQPQVQSATVVAPEASAIARIDNVLVRLPGRARGGKAVLLAAHYDSAPNAPGAADNGASVAAVLETLRALQAGPALDNDVIALFTDAEEVGLLGARAFVDQHPWAKEVGVALNFEFRGNSGPFWMFETSTGNAGLIDGLRGSVKLALSNSLLYEVYKNLPNDTDMSVFKRAGMAGMNFAAAERHTSYHTALDNIASLDRRSVQHEGDIMLALARHFGTHDLQQAGRGDAVYFDLPGVGLVSYGVAWVAPLCIIAVALLAAAVRIALRTGAVRLGRCAAGALVFLALVLLCAAANQLLWLAILSVHPGYRLILQGDTYNSMSYLLAHVALTVAVYMWLQGLLAKWIAPLELAFGAMLCWTLALVATAVAAPGASFLFTWPLLAVLLATGALLSARGQAASAGRQLGLLVLGMAPAVLMIAPLLYLLFFALTPALVGVMAAVLVLLLGIGTPLLAALRRRFVLPALPFAFGLACLAYGAATAGFDAVHPRPSNAFYVQAAPANKHLWVSTDAQLDAWSTPLFGNGAVRRAAPELFGPPRRTGIPERQYWIADAPSVALAAPLLRVSGDRTEDGVRRLSVQVQSQRQASVLSLAVDGAAVAAASVDGQPLAPAAHTAWRANMFGTGDAPHTVELTLKPGQPLALRALDVSYGLPSGLAPVRPAAMMVQPFGLSDTTQALQVVQLP